MGRATARLGVAIVMLMVAGVAAAFQVAQVARVDTTDGPGGDQTLQTTGAAAGSSAAAPELPANFLPPAADLPDLPVPPVPPLPELNTTTAAVPTIEATATTTAPASRSTTTTVAVTTARTFAISPTSGPRNTRITASGGGCGGEGVSIEQFDAGGNPLTGDGGGAQPDGSWSQPIVVNEAPGAYTLRAKCRNDATVLFEYPPVTFTIT